MVKALEPSTAATFLALNPTNAVAVTTAASALACAAAARKPNPMPDSVTFAPPTETIAVGATALSVMRYSKVNAAPDAKPSPGIKTFTGTTAGARGLATQSMRVSVTAVTRQAASPRVTTGQPTAAAHEALAA